MSTRKTPAGETHSPVPGAAAPIEWQRHQMALLAGGTCAVLRGFEALRRIQLNTAHHALQQHEAALAKLRGPCTSTELLALQGNLLRFDTQGAALYWQQMGAVALEMQRQLLGAMGHGADTDGEDATAPLRAYMAAMPGMNEFFHGDGAERGRH